MNLLLLLLQSPPADTSKAKLISRMAKMGKPMLPFSGAVPAGPEDDADHALVWTGLAEISI